ncbi:MAG: acyl-CoA dehydrogenase family protein [Firmicutes bacterium]|nr:acyl-CoA dehydrogenase family protein [Bacillota bacterium]MBR6350955.1 acyl-CoA dehydrogenase family protein [Bacillota bacterium]
MAFFISEDAKDLLKDLHTFCENEMRSQVYEAEKAGFKGDPAGEEIIQGIMDGLQEMGIGTLPVPEEKGGPGLSKMDRAALMEEIAKYDAGITAAFMVNEVALDSVEIAGTEEQKDRCYDILLNGGYGCFCLTEPNAGCDVSGAVTTAVKDGDEYVLNGTKCFITNGPIGDFYVIYAVTDKSVPVAKGGYTAFLIEKGTPGLSVGSVEDKMGIRHSHTSDIVLEDCRVPASAVLGEVGQGFQIAMKTLDISRTWIGIASLGIAQRAIDESVSYLKQRVQFGKPLAKNEVLQFKIADMQMKTEAARQVCAYALSLMDRGEPYSVASAEAKCLASDAAMYCSTEAVQIHGGYGYSREYPVEKLMRDAKIHQIFEGTNEIQRLVIGKATIGKI